MALQEYRRKRNFRRTPEPVGGGEEGRSGYLYVIQKHAASRLHYDLRLELEGTLKSWAVPKGPGLRRGEKRLAVHVEDHPIEYGSFEGVIPKGEYGGGTVMLWDRGSWQPVGDPHEGYRKGKLTFLLHGRKLKGKWTLARMHGDEDKNWLLIKDKDPAPSPDSQTDILEEGALSVSSARTMDEIAEARERVWHSQSDEETKKALDPSRLSGARKGNLPAVFRPQLAVTVSTPPDGDDWLHEIKYDGYRVLCRVTGQKAALITRNGKDWTDKFRGVAGAAESLPLKEALLDGEIVVLRPDGTTDFQALQNVLQGVAGGRIVYYLFDLVHLDGYDLSNVPLLKRKEILKELLELSKERPSPLRYSDHIIGKGPDVFENACRFTLEGIMSKRAESRYLQRRSRSWLKVKCLSQQEFVVGGYTDPSGSRRGLGALLVGYFDESGDLIYSGRVGTGYNEKTLLLLEEKLKRLEQSKSSFKNPPLGREARGVHWVAPELVAEVEFTAWTNEGILRHPSFKALRKDKDPREVTLEKPAPAVDGKNFYSNGGGNRVAGVSLTNPERLFYPEQEITKKGLAEYYEEVSEWILPHLAGRPLSLVRCPSGYDQECFYQKHLNEALPKSLRGVPIREKEGEEIYTVIDSLQGLIALVQLGVLEFHPWQSREDDIERPDRMIFDLDPGPGVQWESVIHGAMLLRERLAHLGLQSFLKTTGGKGLHIVVPLVRRSGWDEVKAFSRAVAERVVKEEPRRFVSTMTKRKREGKIFIDYVRNSRGATAVAAYSTRARPGAPVSTPLAWEELTPRVRSDTFTVQNLMARLRSLASDPWGELLTIRQSITMRMKKEMGMS